MNVQQITVKTPTRASEVGNFEDMQLKMTPSVSDILTGQEIRSIGTGSHKPLSTQFSIKGFPGTVEEEIKVVQGQTRSGMPGSQSEVCQRAQHLAIEEELSSLGNSPAVRFNNSKQTLHNTSSNLNITGGSSTATSGM